MRRNQTKKLIQIGIDEVGRGALAGPVVLAAVLTRGPMRWSHPKFGRIRDSKKLTPRRREEWFGYLTRHPLLKWSVGRAGPKAIDRVNISRAANLVALRLVKHVAPNRRKSFVWLDGGLSLPRGIVHKSLIKGDERKPIIAAASIIAKVLRDRYMTRLAIGLPHYGFEIHKGYGTRLHLAMLRRRGLSKYHRVTFSAPRTYSVRS